MINSFHKYLPSSVNTGLRVKRISCLNCNNMISTFLFMSSNLKEGFSDLLNVVYQLYYHSSITTFQLIGRNPHVSSWEEICIIICINNS